MPDGGKPSKDWSSEFQFGVVFLALGLGASSGCSSMRLSHAPVFSPHSVFWGLFCFILRKEMSAKVG